MKKYLFIVLCLIVALNSVQSSVIFRKFRTLDIKDDKLIDGLKKDPIPVAVEVIEPAILVQDEIIVPIEAEKKLIDSALEPVSVAANEIIPQETKDEQKNSVNEENVNEQKYEKQELNLNKNKEELKEKEQEKLQLKPTLQTSADDQNSELNNEQLRQNIPTGGSTSRPTIFQAAQQAAQQIISSNPLGQLIDTFRRPLTSTLSPGSDQIVVTAPNLLQQFQAGVQNFTNQFTSVFNPNAVQQQAALDTGSTVRPPNLIETFQTNLQNAVSSVFRPLNNNATGTNPLQVVFNPLQAVQNFFAGNRGETTQKPVISTIIVAQQGEDSSQPSAPSQTSSGPLDDKVDYNLKNSQEITDLHEEEHGAESGSAEHEEHEESGEHDEIKDHVLNTADLHETDIELQGTNEPELEPQTEPETSQISHITYNLPPNGNFGIQGNVQVHNYDLHEDVDPDKDPLTKSPQSYQNIDSTNWNSYEYGENRPQ